MLNRILPSTSLQKKLNDRYPLLHRRADGAAVAGQARTTAIVRIQKLLGSKDFRYRFEGTLLTKTVGLTLAEARQHGIAQITHALRHDKSSVGPLQLAAGQVLAGWK